MENSKNCTGRGCTIKILLIDIETAPNIAHVWGLFNQDIGLSQLLESGYVLCWSAKWVGEDKMHFSSVYKTKPRKMLEKIHALLSEADVVVSWNGTSFDVPTLNREFLKNKMRPPAPFAQLDLFLVAKKNFRFVSNKLEYVVKDLGIGAKMKNEGHGLWVKCLNGDKKAWGKMKEYNMKDTQLLEGLYERFRPWIKEHPNVGLRDDVPNGCPNCGKTNLQARGWAYTRMSKYRRYQCTHCGTWTRGGKSVAAATYGNV